MQPPAPQSPQAAPQPPGTAEPLSAGLEEGAKRLLRLAISALARREHSRAELQRKLQRRLGESAGLADLAQVLDRLQARGLLSDTRMAQALVRTRATRYGRRRLEQELERRGVDRDTIAATLPPASADLATARALWQRKFGAPPATAQERARQGRYLAARGFDARLIAKVVAGFSPDEQ